MTVPAFLGTVPLPMGGQAAVAAPDASDRLRRALLDSRQRWRDLVGLACDFAFETDAWGRFVFITPDPALGWGAGTLLGQPGQLLLPAATDAGFDPFRTIAVVRERRGWLRRPDGSLACVSLSVAPLFDPEGRIIGTRGVARDITEAEDQGGQLAGALRRTELLDQILWRMRQEVLASRMMATGLQALVPALGAEGAAVMDLLDVGEGPSVLHVEGGGVAAVMGPAMSLLGPDTHAPVCGAGPDGRPILVCPSGTRFGEMVGLVLWRTSGSRRFDGEDIAIVVSVAAVMRVVLEHEAIQREMARQARSDPLTGLLNRRAFFDEVPRHIDRLDREELPGTLMFLDLDHFKSVNDQLGHEAGDDALRSLASVLRNTVRPTDLVARLGGDEFALWLNGADELTAAERAEQLRLRVPDLVPEQVSTAGGGMARLGASIGIASRQPGGGEDIDTLVRRADLAMYEVKRSGRGQWRVARVEDRP